MAEPSAEERRQEEHRTLVYTMLGALWVTLDAPRECAQIGSAGEFHDWDSRLQRALLITKALESGLVAALGYDPRKT